MYRAAQYIYLTIALGGRLRAACVTVIVALLLLAVFGNAKRREAPADRKIIAGETYDEFDKRREALNGLHGEFEGEGCTQDCGGHEAGYAWGEEKGITDPDRCGGKSWSFIEGCKAYAERASAEGE